MSGVLVLSLSGVLAWCPCLVTSSRAPVRCPLAVPLPGVLVLCPRLVTSSCVLVLCPRLVTLLGKSRPDQKNNTMTKKENDHINFCVFPGFVMFFLMFVFGCGAVFLVRLSFFWSGCCDPLLLGLCLVSMSCVLALRPYLLSLSCDHA